MKKLKMLFLLLCTTSSVLMAQSTLNAAGGETTIGGNTYEFSIGEMALVSTLSTASVIVTQGLLQPTPQWPTNTKDLIISKDVLKVYPNPASAIVNLQPQFSTGGTMQILLLNANGKTMLRKDYRLAAGREKQQIDISQYAQGNYILNVNFSNGKNKSKNSYKIQKLNK